MPVRSRTSSFCEACHHLVYSMEKHVQTEEHKRNIRKGVLVRRGGSDTPKEVEMATGPDNPEPTLQETKGTAVEVIQLEILTCSTCQRDCLFARVLETRTNKRYYFCSQCGEYTEIPGEE